VGIHQRAGLAAQVPVIQLTQRHK